MFIFSIVVQVLDEKVGHTHIDSSQNFELYGWCNVIVQCFTLLEIRGESTEKVQAYSARNGLKKRGQTSVEVSSVLDLNFRKQIVLFFFLFYCFP